jgi:hypothetical protein
VIPTVSVDTLRVAERHALSTVQCLPLREEAAVAPLQTLLGAYDVAYAATNNHDAALYIAAKETRRTIATRPSKTTYSYPSNPGQLARGVEWSAARLAYYCEQLSRDAKERLGGACPASIAFANRLYQLREALPTPLPSTEPLIGLDEEWKLLEQTLRQLFMYDPRTETNEEYGLFPATTVLSGPPGTGKTSLLENVCAEASRLAQLSGTTCTTLTYDASKFSSYFGKTTRDLKKLLERVRDPRGVGIFIMEDADMILQSRDEVHKTHGVQEVQQYLMNTISGLKRGTSNWLAFFTTNRTQDIDEAMRQRFGQHTHIDPFDKQATHTNYFRVYTPHLTTEACERLGAYTHTQALRGRSLKNALTAARSAVTPRITDEELLAKKRHMPVPQPTEDDILAALTAARTIVQGTPLT